MRNGNMLRVRPVSGVTVRVVTRASVGVMVRFYFAVVLHNFSVLCIPHCADAVKVEIVGIGFRYRPVMIQDQSLTPLLYLFRKCSKLIN